MCLTSCFGSPPGCVWTAALSGGIIIHYRVQTSALLEPDGETKPVFTWTSRHIYDCPWQTWNLTSGQPERMFSIQTFRQTGGAELLKYVCTLTHVQMYIHVKRIGLHTHFSEVWLWARCLQNCTWLSTSKTRKKARKRERDVCLQSSCKASLELFSFPYERPPSVQSLNNIHPAVLPDTFKIAYTLQYRLLIVFIHSYYV